MLTDIEIKALKERVKLGDVWWNDGDGVCKRVASVALRWVEFKDEPDNTEPAAMLVGGGAVALSNVTLESFVTIQECLTMEDYPETLAILQNAARNGLNVNFMTGDISIPKHLQPNT